MNFLLHRELSLRELGSPVAGVGAMLPDLWRMAERRVRARAEVVAAGELQRGVAHHLEADRWFHGSEVFHAGERDTTRALLDLEVPKLGRFGHIAWELCLDGALLANRDFEAELEGLRADLERVDPSAAAALAARHGASTLDAATRSRFHDRMNRIVAGLAEGSFIEGYRHGAGLAERVEAIRRRVRLEPLDEAGRIRLAEVLDDRLGAASALLPSLFEARRAHLAARGPLS